MASAAAVHADALASIPPGMRAEIAPHFECLEARPLAPGAWALEARAVALDGRPVTVHLFAREQLRRRDAERALDDGLAAWRTLVHPNALTPVRAGGGEESRWVVSAAVHDEDLASRMRRDGPVALDDAMRIVEQLASVLHEAHRRGAAHGAVRPDQVLLDGRGWVTLLGGGVVHVVDRLAGRADADPSAAEDQSDLARLLLACLVGEPGRSSDERIAVDLVPAAALDVIRQATSPRAAARYADVFEFVSAFRAALRSNAPASPLVRPQPLLLVGPPLGSPRRGALAAAGALCAAALVVSTLVPARPSVTSLATMSEPAPAPAGPVAPVAAVDSAPIAAPITTPVEEPVLVAESSPRVPDQVPASPPVPRRDPRPARAPIPTRFPARTPTPRPAPRTAPTPLQTPERAPSADPSPAPLLPAASVPAVSLPAPVDVAEASARLSVSARPWGDIYIDGRAMGSTPKAQLAVDPGPRRIRIVRPGFGIFDTLVVVRPGEHLRLIDVRLPAVSP